MPYIKEEAKRELASRVPQNPGELTFVITELLADYWYFGTKNYQSISDILGSLSGAKAEFLRRIVAPYEDIKIKENGDVF